MNKHQITVTSSWFYYSPTYLLFVPIIGSEMQKKL